MNRDEQVEQRIEDLLSRMTLEEKIGQLKARFFGPWNAFFELSDGLPPEQRMRTFNLIRKHFWRHYWQDSDERDVLEAISANYVKKHWKEIVKSEEHGIGVLTWILHSLPPRESAELANEIQKFALQEQPLGIPVLIHDECLHGIAAKGSTIFPQAIGLASTWDPDLMKEVAIAIGKETRARGIHQCYSPTINIARDPRCGRTEETYGEDPYLTSVMGVSFVEGLRDQGVRACPKHFVANFVGDGGRDSDDIDFSERILREIYLPAFKDCIQKAGTVSLMSAYNSIDGVPCTCNKWLLTNILREEWGFKGFVISDLGASSRENCQSVTKTKCELAKKAIESGLDVELETDCYRELAGIVKEGELSENVVEESVRRILRVKFLLGLFENPYTDPDHTDKICDCEEHRSLALTTAREAIILLKNDDTLPMSKDLESIAVIGPNADQKRLGGYSGFGSKVITPLEGIRNKASKKTAVQFAEGCELTGSSREGFQKALEIARGADAAILVMGNSVPETEGEGRDRCNLDLPGLQEDLIKEICRTGTPVVVVLINGSAITMTKWIDDVNAVVEAWYPGEEGGNAIGDILFGDYNPGGRLPITFPKTVGQLPLYYNYKPTGRVYDYVDLRGKQPLFPFGHGLSYTEFEYSNLEIEPENVDPEGNVSIGVDVKNTGKCKGDEVVQLYIRDVVASTARPVKELRGFNRITLKPDDRETVNFCLTPEDLACHDMNMNLVVEPGVFDVMIGGSSEDIRLRGSFEVKPKS